MNNMKCFDWELSQSALAFLMVMTGGTALAAEFHFVIHDVEADTAAWSPHEVVIHKRSVFEEKLVFILENPTARTHVFEAPGLFEQIVEGSETQTVKPLRVYVAPGETVHVQVSTDQLSDLRVTLAIL